MRPFAIMLMKLTPLALALSCNPALACSFPQGFRYQLGRPVLSFLDAADEAPAAPSIELLSLKRGFDDGNFASCSDAGILTLVLIGDTPRNVAGYEFQLVEGEFPDDLPTFPVKPTKLDDDQLGFRFLWLDLPYGRSLLEPMDARIEVRAVSTLGSKSEPTRIRVAHRGGVPYENLPEELRRRLERIEDRRNE